ncbi:stalk domain-containing protein [Paenibacillus sp. GCM10027628]|uniref:stalk domain-containing protein n=1 Tax=Paenibacillus sp. GCM10027628 TaxID=3273413 RepID=UPI003629AF57
MLKGGAWTPYDADGIKQDAITYDGSTYLPLRSVAVATGLKVDWNDSTKTIVQNKFIIQNATHTSLHTYPLSLHFRALCLLLQDFICHFKTLLSTSKPICHLTSSVG